MGKIKKTIAIIAQVLVWLTSAAIIQNKLKTIIGNHGTYSDVLNLAISVILATIITAIFSIVLDLLGFTKKDPPKIRDPYLDDPMYKEGVYRKIV